MKSAILTTALLLSLSAPARPQSGSAPSAVEGPVLGFLFDAGAHGIRPILGIPGAALLGAPVDAGVEVLSAAISPRQDFFLITSKDDRVVRLMAVRDGRLSSVPLEGVLGGVDFIVISPSGTAAALFRASDKLLQVLTGLPQAPDIQDPVAVSMPGNGLAALAITDDGHVTGIQSTEQDAPPLVYVSRSGAPRPVPVAGAASAMNFRPGTHDLLIAAGNQLLLAQNVSENAGYRVLAQEQDGVDAPVAVSFSRDGSRAFAANGGSGTILNVPVTGGTPSVVACQCTPVTLAPLKGGAIFRLTDSSQGPLLVLDASGTNDRVLFVPPEPTPDSDAFLEAQPQENAQ